MVAHDLEMMSAVDREKAGRTDTAQNVACSDAALGRYSHPASLILPLRM